MTERRFEEVVADYLDQLDAGETLEVMRILAEHPEDGREIVESLRGFIDIPATLEYDQPLGTLGDYTLRRQIGRGGMGVVYEGWQNSVERSVALKVLPAGIAADERSLQRFVREAKTAAQLDHPNVVGVHGMGLEKDTPYYAMEYIEGETLAQVMGRLKEAEPETETPFGKKDDTRYFVNIAEAFADVADGLQHAHSKGVIHRDIKPSNLILDAEADQDGRANGHLRILDFGLARLEGQESLTVSGDVVGTPAYMSPEQAKRKKIPIDHRTDIYSLGATLYELLTHQQPFRGKDHADTLSQIIERDPRPPRQLNPRVPQDLETIVLKCLRKDPADRYRTAEALGQDMRRVVRGDAIEARPESALERVGRNFLRHRRVLTGAIVLLVLLVAGLAAANLMIARARNEARYDLYVADMRLAMEDWRSGNLARFERILTRHRPEQGGHDLRGWEWHYLRGLTEERPLTFTGHSGALRAVAWSPDGTRLASGGDAGLVQMWDVGTGEGLLDLPAGASIRKLFWSGERLVAQVGENAVKIWESLTGALVQHIVHESEIWDLDVGPDGLLLAGAARKAGCRIWSPHGDVLFDLEVEGEVRRVSWNPDGKRLAVFAFLGYPALPETRKGKKSASLTIWDADRWQELRRISLWADDVRLRWGPEGRRLAMARTGYSTIEFWDPAAGKLDHTLPQPARNVGALAWSPSGELAVAADRALQIWPMQPTELERTLRGHRQEVAGLVWSPDARLLASASVDGTLKVWDPAQESEVTTLEGHRWIGWSDRYLATRARRVARSGGIVSIFDATSLEKLLDVGQDRYSCMALSKQGDLIALCRSAGVEIFALPSGDRRWSFGRLEGRTLRGPAWSPDGGILAIGGSKGKVLLWKRGSEQELQPLVTGGGQVLSVAWSRDGALLAARCVQGRLTVWATGSWTKRFHRDFGRTVSHHARGDPLVTWSPSDERLAVATDSGAVVILDAATGAKALQLEGHGDSALSVSWSPDGTRIASSSEDRTVKIWDTATGEELLSLRGHRTEVRGVAWSPDGSRLASAGGLSLKIWDATAGYEIEDREP